MIRRFYVPCAMDMREELPNNQESCNNMVRFPMQIAQSSQFCVPSLFKNRFDLREGKFNMKYYRPVIFLLEHDIMKVLPSFQSPNSETTSNSGWTSITHPSGGKLTLDGTFRLIYGASCVPPRVSSPNAIRRVSGGVQISPQTKRLKFRVAFINDISGHSKLSRNSPSGGKLRAASFCTRKRIREFRVSARFRLRRKIAELYVTLHEIDSTVP